MSKKRIKWSILFTGLAILCFIAVVISLSNGSANIPFKKICTLLIGGAKPGTFTSAEETILFRIRLPRIILGFMVGGALSLAGVILQAMFRNPLVEPYTLGISGGAGLAVSLVIVLGLFSAYALPLAGFAGALTAITFVYSRGAKRLGIAGRGLLLTGVMVSFIASSLIMLILSLARADEAHSILFWIMGNLGENDFRLITIVSVIILLSVLISLLKAWRLNAICLGDEEALHLGIDVVKEKRYLFILASIMAGTAVSVSGIIGFVGLVVPHFMRMLTGTDHRVLMPSSFILGGVFLILCDTLARTIIAPVELPVGVITGLIGGIIFLYFLTGKRDTL